MSTDTYDAVVIGAGPNGLVAANHLLDKGWSVLVLEAQPDVGGAVASDTEVAPGFVHDTFSAFYPLGAASPVLKALDLESYGVRWRHAPAVLGHPLPDGRWALLHRDRQITADGLETGHPGDGQAWLELVEMWDRIGDPILEAMLTPFPPVRGGARAATSVLRTGGVDLVRTLVAPAMAVLQERFGGDLARMDGKVARYLSKLKMSDALPLGCLIGSRPGAEQRRHGADTRRDGQNGPDHAHDGIAGGGFADDTGGP